MPFFPIPAIRHSKLNLNHEVIETSPERKMAVAHGPVPQLNVFSVYKHQKMLCQDCTVAATLI